MTAPLPCGTARPEPIRILIVDDDAGLRTALLAIFGAHPHYSAQAATDAADGLSRISTFRPHLVLLDLRQPGLAAADLCRAVRASPAMRSIRILAMSGPPDEDAGPRLLAAGADAFLPKPFTLAQLEAEVARLV
ncbi:MAG TPA: response regulator [Candidatus Acidoferrum sp.]|nr:response regulator [Candidatus Acidoferrum sp.]